MKEPSLFGFSSGEKAPESASFSWIWGLANESNVKT